MGWVGVATLIATACFILYRYPPTSRTPQPEPRPSAPNAAESKSDDSSPGLVARHTQDVKSESNLLSNKAIRNKEEEEGPRDSEDPESQSTPKASASPAPPLEVPTLCLDDHRDRNDTIEMKGSITATEANSQDKGQPGRSQNGPTIAPVSAPTNASMPPPPKPQSPPSSASARSSSLMPPPSAPRLRPTMSQNQNQTSSLLSPGRGPPRPSAGSSLRPPPSAASQSRRPPPSGNSLSPNQLTVQSPNSSRRRPVLEPGYSPLDWAALTSNPKNQLRGANLPPHLIRVTPSVLKAQNGRKGTDAWTSYQGKVYNITPYLPFHPGGKGELLRGAGKDSAKLFMEIHPWVNWDAMLGECLVGILVSENEGPSEGENTLDAMD